MSLEAVVVNKDCGLVEAFVAVARPRGRAAQGCFFLKYLGMVWGLQRFCVS